MEELNNLSTEFIFHRYFSSPNNFSSLFDEIPDFSRSDLIRLVVIGPVLFVHFRCSESIRYSRERIKKKKKLSHFLIGIRRKIVILFILVYPNSELYCETSKRPKTWHDVTGWCNQTYISRGEIESDTDTLLYDGKISIVSFRNHSKIHNSQTYQ